MTPLRVVQVIDSLHGGGAETSLVELDRQLVRADVQVTLVTLRPDDGSLEVQVAGLPIERVRLEGRSPLRQLVALTRMFREQRPDLIHTSLLRSNVLGRIAGRLAGVPVLTTLANDEFGPAHRANSRRGSWTVVAARSIERWTAPLTSHFHAVSAEVARVMGQRLRIPADRITVVHRGRSGSALGSLSAERRAAARDQLAIGDETPVVLSVGRLDRQKAVDVTIAAFARLRDNWPDAVLLVAGRRGNAAEQIDRLVAEVPGVRVLGHRTDVADLMCAADVLAFPSRWEGLGGTLIEALALRLPIVATRIGPIVEVLGNVDWPLVPPDDPDRLAEALSGMLSRRSSPDPRSDAGRERFESWFTIERTAVAMRQLYAHTADGVGRSA